MEKQANNLSSDLGNTRSLHYFTALLFFFIAALIQAQDISYEDGKRYILGGLEVTGLQSYNEQTVKTYTGLRIGQPITVPGDEISAVINKLWGLELFTDINFYITNIEGENVFLELNIIERPTLTDVTVYGEKKRKIAEIIKDADLKKGKKITESLIANTKNYLQNKYKKKGHLNAHVNIVTSKDTVDTNTEKMVINIKKGPKVKIRSIAFEGNEQLTDKKLRKALKNT
ncbi:MAG TPA: POTRA domain-containing protein, partial [Arenibacter sp.]|nr:POTRA domain-containing protein [Arenibacter sp.]